MSSAVIGLIIFGVCIVLYILNKFSNTLIALAGLLAMIVFNVVDFSDAFKNFSSSAIVTVCGMMVFGKALQKTGLTQYFSEKVVALVSDNERKLIIVSSIITAIMSSVISNTAVFIIMLEVLIGICSKNKNIHYMNLIMPVAIASIIGGSITLVGAASLLTASNILEEFLGVGNGFKFFTFLIPSVTIITLFILYVTFIGYPLGKRIWGDRIEYSENNGDSSLKKIDIKNKNKMPVMILIFISTILLFIFCNKISIFIPNLSIPVISLLAALSCILTGCVTVEEALHSMNWKIVIWLGLVLGMAVGLNKSGGAELIANFIIKLLGNNIQPFALYAVFVVLAIIMTQFLSNSAALSAVLPVACSVIMDLGFNTYSMAVGITLAATISVASPLAHANMAMAMVGKYKFGDFIKYAGPFALLSALIVLIMIPIIWPFS